MVIEVRPKQLEKASTPMLAISAGIIVLLHPVISVLEAVSIRALQLFLLSY